MASSVLALLRDTLEPYPPTDAVIRIATAPMVKWELGHPIERPSG
jgi:hypothetical protein